MGNRDFAQHSERPPHDESIRSNSTFVKSTIADSIKDEVSVPSMLAVLSLLYIASAASLLCTAGTTVGQLTFLLLAVPPMESGLLECAFRRDVFFLSLLLGYHSAHRTHGGHGTAPTEI